MWNHLTIKLMCLNLMKLFDRILKVCNPSFQFHFQFLFQFQLCLKTFDRWRYLAPKIKCSQAAEKMKYNSVWIRHPSRADCEYYTYRCVFKQLNSRFVSAKTSEEKISLQRWKKGSKQFLAMWYLVNLPGNKLNVAVRSEKNSIAADCLNKVSFL